MSTVTLHMTSQGSGQPPLVLLHGYTGSHLDWADVQPELAKDRRVLTFDHRGHGESPNLGTQEAYTFQQLADDFVAALAEHGIDRIHLLGHSMGGVISQLVTLQHPELIESLILMDTAAEPMGGLPMEAIEGLAAVGRAQGMAAALGMVAEMAKAARAEQNQPELSPEREALMAERGATKFQQVDPEAFVALGHQLGSHPSMVHRLVEIAVPTTVIVGANDVTLVPAAEVLAREIANATLVVIPDAGHSPQEDQPELWLDAVRSHLAKVTA